MPRFRKYRKSYAKNKLATTTTKATRSDVAQNKEIIKMKKQISKLKKESFEPHMKTIIAVNNGALADLVNSPNVAATLISNMAQGTDFDERLGDKAVLTNYKATLWVNETVVHAFCWFRYVVFWDMDATPTPATWDEVFGGYVGGSEFEAMPRFEARRRFKILYDKSFSLDHIVDNGAAVLGTKLIKVNVPLKSKIVEWTDATGTSQIGRHLYQFMVTNVDNVPTEVQANWQVNLYYNDN